MNEMENKPAETSELSELREQCAALEKRTSTVQAALIVTTLSLAFIVGVQVRRSGKDLDAIRPQLAQWIDANKKQDPVIQNLAQKLVDFGRSHPDFSPIVMKYGLNTNAAFMSASPPAK